MNKVMWEFHSPTLPVVLSGFIDDNFLLFGTTERGGILYQLNLTSESMDKIQLKYPGIIQSVAYDPRENNVYFTDGKRIKRRNLNGTNEEIVGQWCKYWHHHQIS